MTKSTKRHRKLPTWAFILICALTAILVLILAIGITVNAVLNKISRPDIDQEYYTEDELLELDLQEAVKEREVENAVVYPELDPEDVSWGQVDENIGKEQELVNILLIGQDARAGETRARSDSIILVTFNKTTKHITMTSFLRDLYVQIPGYQDNRINAAYAFGGMELLDATLKQNFGVDVDANVAVNFEGFSSIVDILGGVDIDLTAPEAEVLGLSSGLQHLDGDTALSYARIRHIDSDFSRTGRQRNVLNALFNSLKTAELTQLLQLVDTIFPLITTDLSNAQILAYATELFPMLSTGSMTSSRVPAEDTYSLNTINGMSVIVADMYANRTILKETLEPEG